MKDKWKNTVLQVKIFPSKVEVNGSPSAERGKVQMEHHEVFSFLCLHVLQVLGTEQCNALSTLYLNNCDQSQ